jgi:hypothetical protein
MLFEAVFRGLADPAERAAWSREKNMLVFAMRDQRGEMYVDLFLEYPIAWDKLYRDSVVVNLNGIPVRVASLEHLIAMRPGDAMTPPADPLAAQPGNLPDHEIAQLRDALRLSPGERLHLVESLWAFARATAHYLPKTPDQFRLR